MVRLGFIIGLVALIGVLLSGLAAYRVHDQELTLDGIAMARAIDVHASLVQDRLTERELLVDCLRRLNRTGVVYYLTGSMASNYWGIPRTTHDLDFVVQFPATTVPLIFQEFSGDFYIEEAAVRAVEK